jgi:integrase
VTRRGRNEGSIYERHDGRWTASLDLGFIDGRRVRKAFYGPTRKAVADKLASALGRRQQGGLIRTNDAISVGAYLDGWLGVVSVRPKTLRQYKQVVRLYLKPAIGPQRLARLEPSHVRALTQGMEERGLSPRTATLARDILRIALSQAVTDQLLVRNVAAMVRRPKPTRSNGETLSGDEARALIDRLRGHRLEAVVTCGVALGLRLGEVLGLQWSDLDLPNRRLTLNRALQTLGKKRELVELKTRESRRTMTLPALVARALERHKTRQAARRLAAGAVWQRSDFVFTTGTGRPMDGTLVSRDLKRLLLKTWFGGDGQCVHARTKDRECLDCAAVRLPALSFHGLRHSCASLLLAAGVPVRDVSELLGHSDVRLTLNTYAHVIDAGRSRTAGIMDGVLDSQSDSHSVRRG